MTVGQNKILDKTLQKCRNIEIIKWLDENYTVNEGVCMPRCILYGHYLEFCRARNVIAACPATFGKTIRQKFPNLTTRRLGTRGKSKYHYYGIGIKESSPYYNGLHSFSGLTRFSGGRTADQGQYLSENTGTLLPPFPSAKRLVFPSNIPTAKVDTFFIMYKTHCQCVLNAVINANFDQIDTFLCHFWQGIPTHLISLMKEPAVIDIVCYYDHTLYKVLNDIMIPKAMQAASGHILSEIRTMVKRFESWVVTALKNLPETLLKRKLIVATHFIHSLRRQTSFIFLMLEWQRLYEKPELQTKIVHCVKGIKVKTNDIEHESTNQDTTIIYEVISTWKKLMANKSSINGYIEWLDDLVKHEVAKNGLMRLDEYQPYACHFLALWSKATQFVSTRMKGCEPSVCDAIHTLKMMLNEYLCLAMESKYYRNLDSDMQESLNKYYMKDDQLYEIPSIASDDPFLDPSSETGTSESDIDEEQSHLDYTHGNRSMDDCYSISSSPVSVSCITDDTEHTPDCSSASTSGNVSPQLLTSYTEKSNTANMELSYRQNLDSIPDLDSYLVVSINSSNPTQTDPTLAWQNTALKRSQLQDFDKYRRPFYHHCHNSSTMHVDGMLTSSSRVNRNKELSLTSTQQQSLTDKNRHKLAYKDSNYQVKISTTECQPISYFDQVFSSSSIGDTSDSLAISDDDISNEIDKSSIDTLLYPNSIENDDIINSAYDPYLTYGQLQNSSSLMTNQEEIVDLTSW
ncbi:uncharacterized protein TRIADDRAFT_51678 [Trichoplax adhaerens]|uniref:DNA-binding protein RFX6 n=1 Tax=Trichoplax adhaerens TaxID=10228 RepID=B3RKH1_TRIAD|nr:hypothetical protein TRIADDRAFT_51678 [Trichoplax adhaerens]EDV28599.1 hypothetical protein TRIADDRAFT_51678 [Trichoplax adhaerens]|eukprot:XP_002107801.1 hypothetical protein TRIADDRAFT_51678 [Trichoplax adhaerens]